MAEPVDLSKLPRLTSRDAVGGELVSVDAEAGVVTASYRPPQELANPIGSLQGGYALAMLDDVSGSTTWFGGGGRPFTTAQISANFLKAVPMGEPLLGEGRIVHNGRRQSVVEAELRREKDGAVLVRATVMNVFLE
ncbi:MAG: PaaI family thioesterase [Gammaproteobacteria bacterium]|nr:PaaI family thioesterase [Gammaproteobacteria bacterium]MXW46450.1 PaaI family thioesterase [Gammaproteobacteria bacterium]MYD02121.1 PaaI family thioesterase [Gammaproteobacteria bacterium]MYI24586.1 PaaI family thioesterase [Gammaproteobacteria bacterium]